MKVGVLQTAGILRLSSYQDVWSIWVEAKMPLKSAIWNIMTLGLMIDIQYQVCWQKKLRKGVFVDRNI